MKKRGKGRAKEIVYRYKMGPSFEKIIDLSARGQFPIWLAVFSHT